MRSAYRKWISFVLAAAMLLTLLPASALAEESRMVSFQDAEAFGSTLLSVQRVSQGSAAVAPSAPRHEGYRFSGWDKDFSSVTADMIVTATYITQCSLNAACTLEDGHEGDCSAQGGAGSGSTRPQGSFRVDFVDWDGSLLETQYILSGEAAAAPQDPTRDGYRFVAWSPADIGAITADLTVTATYALLDSVFITINYFFADNTIAAIPYVAQVKTGDPFSAEVSSPLIPGFTPDQNSISISQASVSADLVYEVFYTPGDNSYKIENYLEELTEGQYSFREAFVESGKTGDKAVIPQRGYTGFTQQKVSEPPAIAADGSTVVKVYYTRNAYELSYDTLGGSYLPPAFVKYEESYTLEPNPTRYGYAFEGWTASPDTLALSGDKISGYTLTMPASDVSLTAQWTGESANYTVVYWLENAGNPVKGTANAADYAGDDYIGAGFAYVGSTAGLSGAVGSVPAVPTSAPSGVTMPIGSGYYRYNASKTAAVNAGVTVAGDNSTVVNVYFDRNEYTLSFKGNYNSYSGAYGFERSITANFGADIHTQWEAINTAANTAISNFYGWEGYDYSAGQNISYVTTQYVLDGDMVAYQNSEGFFPAATNDNTQKMTIYYKGQSTSGQPQNTGETGSGSWVAIAEQEINVTKLKNNGSGTFYAKDFDGFTAVTASKTYYRGTSSLTFYYIRNQYALTFNNKGAKTDITGIYYRQDISQKGFTPTRPATVDGDYSFGGWYTSEQCYDGTEFSFTDATMPAKNLILYARWNPPSYTVSFNLNGAASSPIAPLTVKKNSAAPKPADPSLTGYTFVGWCRETAAGGVGALFSFATLINADTRLIAKWVKRSDVTLTVNHLYADDTVAKPSETVQPNTTGDTVTVYAQGFYQGGVLYLPDHRSKSCVVTGDAAADQVTFYYTAAYGVKYQVVYRAYDGSFPTETADKTTPDNQNTASVTETYKNFPGYYPDAYQKLLWLSADQSENVLTFTYRKNGSVGYTVEHYTQNPNGQGYTLYGAGESGNDAVGITVTAAPKSIPGFTYQPSISADSVKLTSNISGNVMRLYYTRNRYTVGFAIQSGQESMGALTGSTVFSGYYQQKWYDAVSVPGITPADGYMFDAWTPGLPAQGSNLTKDETYIASLKENPAQWFSVTYKANGGTGDDVTVPHLCLNSAYTVMDNPYTRANWDFVSWNTDPLGKGVTYAPNGDATMQGNLVLYAQWKEHDKYSVSYAANAPSGHTATGSTAGAVGYVNQKVAVAANGYSVYGYKFVKWNTAPDASGTDYYPGAEYTLTQDLALYAIWEKDASLWYTLTYNANHGSGTLPADGSQYLSGSSAAVQDGDGLSRKGYEFIGWTIAKDPAVGDTYYKKNELLTMDGNKTLYAQWEAMEYTLGYIITGAVAPANPYKTDTFRYGESVTPQSEPALEGYVFSGWTDAQGTAFSFPATMPAEDLVVYGKYVPGTVAYTVEHYTQALDGSWVMADSEDKTGLTGAAAAYRAGSYPGFTLDDARTAYLDGSTALTGVSPILANGKLKIQLYYTRNGGYAVTYAYGNAAPTGAAAAPAGESNVKYDTEITVSNNPAAPAGYSFSGWASGEVSAAGGEKFNMPDGNVSFAGSWSANTDTGYTVEVYLEKLDGSYELANGYPESRAGTTDTTADFADSLRYTGFSENTAHTDRLVSGVIAGDGSLTLKRYFDRMTFDVGYSVAAVPGPDSASYSVPAGKTGIKYGASVAVEADPAAAGWTFHGWASNDLGGAFTDTTASFQMPATDVTLSGYWSANTDTGYIVEHYQQDIGGAGYTLADTDLGLTGTTGQAPLYQPKTYSGFSYDSTLTVAGVIAGDGGTVVKLYYKRQKFDVSYLYGGVLPSGAPALPTGGSYWFGEDVTAAANVALDGYDFSGWASGEVSVAPGSAFSMPAKDVTISGSFTAKDADYVVEYYFASLSGQWEFNAALTVGWAAGGTGKTDALIAFTPPAAPAGYVYSKTVNNPSSGRIPRTGQLVIKVYYERSKFPYTVEYYVDGALDSSLGYTGAPTAYGETVASYPDRMPVPGYKLTRDTLGTGLVISQKTGDNIIRVYYDKDSFAYSILYRDSAGNAIPGVADATGAKALFDDGISVSKAGVTVGAAVTANPAPLGYSYSAAGTAAMHNPARISHEAARNVIVLVYDKIDYTLQYALTDASGNVLTPARLGAMGLALPGDETYQVDNAAGVAALPSHAGYTLAGWNTLQDMTGTDYAPGQNYKLLPSGGAAVSTLWARVVPKRFDVSYEIIAPAKFARKIAPVQADYASRQTVAADPAGSIYAGWSFTGWSSGDAVVSGGEFTMPGGNVLFTGAFTANSNTPYTVEYLFEQAAGGYASDPAYPPVSKQGTTDAAAPYDTPQIPNFAFDHGEFASVVNGSQTLLAAAQVQGDGSLVIRLYYRIVRYSVSFRVYPHPAGSFNTPNVFSGLMYGDPMPAAPSYAINGGYQIDYWSIEPSQLGATVTGDLEIILYCKEIQTGVLPGGGSPTPTPEPSTAPVATPGTTSSPQPSVMPTSTPTAAAVASINDEGTPLAAPESPAWALLNLILAIVTALASAVLLITNGGKRSRQRDGVSVDVKKKTGWRLASLIPALGGIVVFLLTENMLNPMVWMDQWTLLMAAIALIQLGNALLSFRSEKQAKPAEEEL